MRKNRKRSGKHKVRPHTRLVQGGQSTLLGNVTRPSGYTPKRESLEWDDFMNACLATGKSEAECQEDWQHYVEGYEIDWLHRDEYTIYRGYRRTPKAALRNRTTEELMNYLKTVQADKERIQQQLLTRKDMHHAEKRSKENLLYEINLEEQRVRSVLDEDYARATGLIE